MKNNKKVWEKAEKFLGKGWQRKASLIAIISNPGIDRAFKEKAIKDYVMFFAALPENLPIGDYKDSIIEAIKESFSEIGLKEDESSLKLIREEYTWLIMKMYELDDENDKRGENLLRWFCRFRAKNWNWGNNGSLAFSLEERIIDFVLTESKTTYAACWAGPDPLPAKPTELFLRKIAMEEMLKEIKKDEKRKKEKGYNYKGCLVKFSEVLWERQSRAIFFRQDKESNLLSGEIKFLLSVVNKTTPFLINHVASVASFLIEKERDYTVDSTKESPKDKKLAWLFIKHNLAVDAEKTKESFSCYSYEWILESLIKNLPELRNSELGGLIKERISFLEKKQAEEVVKEEKKKQVAAAKAKMK